MTNTIIIDGPTVELDSGEEHCIGVYLDSDGDVWFGFNLPPGSYEVDTVVDTVKYITSETHLPDVIPSNSIRDIPDPANTPIDKLRKVKPANKYMHD